jgi:hypothetical protein
MDNWHRLEGIMRVTQRTGHSSFYVEKGKNILAKSPEQLGMKLIERLGSQMLME